MKVAFLGNHTVGVTALRALNEVAAVGAVVAHPDDPEDGVRYESVHDWAQTHGLRVVRGRGTDAQVLALLESVQPDLLWVTDYRYLLPAQVLALAPHGAINLHPSLLPLYRGRAPLNWAILRGETEVGLSAHVVDEGMDSGDLLDQVRVPVRAEDDIGTVLTRLMPHYDAMPRRIMAALANGTLSRTPQDHSRATVYPRRTPEDGQLHWEHPATDLHNLVRAITAPYPGAFTSRRRADTCQRILVWRTRVEPVVPPAGIASGTVFALEAGVPLVCCGPSEARSALALISCTTMAGEPLHEPWTVGEVLA